MVAGRFPPLIQGGRKRAFPRALAGLRYGTLTGTPVHKENTAFSMVESFRSRPDTTQLEMARACRSCLLFGRETHASTSQSDPLLLPTRNGPCREDGALHWEYLFYRVQHPPP